MNNKLRILIIDDNPLDRSLIIRLLKHEFPGIETIQILGEESFNRALNDGDFNLVITDYKLSWSDGLKVLHSVKDHFPDTPVVMFTDSGNDEIAIESIKAGLDDYIVKSQEHFVRLSSAIMRILNRAEQDDKFEESTILYQKLFERVPIGLYRTAKDGKILDANPALLKMLGYPDKKSLLSINAKDTYVNAKDRRQWIEIIERNGVIRGFEMQLKCFDGEIIWVKDNAYGVRDRNGQLLYYEGSLEDITERKRAEDALLESEEKYKTLTENVNVGIYRNTIGPKGKFIEANPAIVKIFGFETKDDLLSLNVADLYQNPDDRRIFNEKILKFGFVKDEELQLKKKDGTPIYASISAVAVKGENGEVKYYDGIIEDITERKMAEQKLKESKERFEDVALSSADWIWEVDKNGRYTYASGKVKQILGYEPEELIGKTPFELMPEEEAERNSKIFNKITSEKGPIVDLENWNITKEGEKVCMLTNGVPIFDANGDLIGYRGVDKDITDRRRAEEVLRESESRYRLLANNVSDIIFILDMNLRFTYISPSVTNIMGYSVEKGLAKTIEEVLTPASLEIAMKTFEEEKTIEEKEQKERDRSQTLELELICKDGSTIWTEVKLNFLRDSEGLPVGILGIARDVTERRKTEKALKDSEKTYHAVYDTTIALAEGVDLEVVIQVIADRATELLDGRDCVVYLLEKNRKVLIPLYSNTPENRDEIMSYMVPLGKGLSGRVSETGEGAYINFGDEGDYSIHIPDTDRGEDAFESIISVPMFDGNEVLGVITVGKQNFKFQDSDIKKLIIFARQAEIAIKRARDIEKLRESEGKYRILVEESYDAVFIYRDNKLLFANDQICEITGYTKEELYGMDVWELIHPEDINKIKEMAVRKEKGESVPKTYEARVLTKNGEVRVGEWAIDIIKFKGKNAVLGTVRDITDYKEMEDEIQKAEKLESVGILAGGIAHDFNNLLTGIMGNISLAKTHVEPDGEAFEILTEAEKASRKAEKLTQQLLTFSMGGAPIKETASITEIIIESAEFALRGSNVRCEFDFPDNLWMIEFDRNQMSQVVNNLIINADQAMQEGGVIRVSASNIIVSEENNLPIDPGRYVEISIEDGGVGITEENLSNIFDPFFSTKDSGSGLGLTTAYSIIQRHDGYINVDSEVGVGSTFYIYLPTVVKEIEEKESLEEIEAESFKVGKRVLVMDDEEVIREVAGRMLERLGYEVEFASSGEEAVEVYREAFQSGDGFNAVIMDLTVPGGMGGKEAIDELLKIDPDVKAIVSSGYFNDPVMANFKEYGFSGVVPKPYNTEELEDVLRKVLEGEGRKE